MGYLRGCMRGKTLEWFDEEITTKQNWELANLLNNTGQANIVALGNAIVKLRAVKGRQADYKSEELRKKFLNALPLSWLEKAEDITVTQKAQVPASQIVEQVRQPRGPPLSLQSEEDLKNYYIAEYLKELDLLNKNNLDSAYSIDKIENAINEDKDVVNQLTNQLQKPFTPINFQNTLPDLDNEEEGYDEENNRKTYVIPTYSKALVAKDLPKEEQESSS
ncbi:14743_t:CDS:2 [Cetraspora pellucida]|uniref:14743_t:CDS:1 n=1 Tax=Cetraspora pellucida TaxID=1433469 RepID=A0A9N8VEH1_9GLOM|nr:14743_t:CDS:2 [Cetraspora pellucida]